MDLADLPKQKMTGSFQSVGKSRHYVVFRIDQQRYALPLDHVSRAVRMVAVTPIPDSPHSMLGIIAMAGQMLPVIDLRRLFGQPGNKPDLQDVLLIVEIQDQTVAVMVDEVLNIVEFSSKQIQSPPAAVAQSRFLSAAVQQEDTLILVLDASQLLPNHNAQMVNGSPSLENPGIQNGDEIEKEAASNKKGESKARPFLTGLTR
jgi:purine-binding chemotaxis protein CheW